ncbi:hypothetical protein HAX54_002494 [Datura stramonium]|uniref:Uncharacterized protein n=1 Tax=Datura stramonium TaxID=4076 RepID=A0ABS8WTS0_DATST|nr:hypothetical protein [Datura stramonium]
MGGVDACRKLWRFGVLRLGGSGVRRKTMRENRGKLGGCYGTPKIMVVWWQEEEDEGERIGGFRFGVSGEERNSAVVLVFRLEKMEGFGGVRRLFWSATMVEGKGW